MDTCDLPVLVDPARLLGFESLVSVELPFDVGAPTEQQVHAALRQVYGAGYTDRHPPSCRAPDPPPSDSRSGAAGGTRVAFIRAAADRLLHALSDAVEHADSQEDRGRARGGPDAHRTAGRDVLVNVAGGALGGLPLADRHAVLCVATVLRWRGQRDGAANHT